MSHHVHALLSSLALLALGACTSSSGTTKPDVADKPKPCPSIYKAPHAEIDFEPALGQAGTFDVDLTIDGQAQTCQLTVAGIGPSQADGNVVRSPSTRTETTCKGLYVSGIYDNGHLAGLKTEGTPARVALTLKKGNAVMAKGDFTFAYKPTELKGKGCGTTKYANVKLPLGQP